MSTLTFTPRYYSSSPAAPRNTKPSPTAPAQPSLSQSAPANEYPVVQPAASATQGTSEASMSAQRPPTPPSGNRKRKSIGSGQEVNKMADTSADAEARSNAAPVQAENTDILAQEPKVKKSRTNTPWTPAEELRLKQMRDAGNSWSEIAKVRNHHNKLHPLTYLQTFPQRTEGSVKKHWYKVCCPVETSGCID